MIVSTAVSITLERDEARNIAQGLYELLEDRAALASSFELRKCRRDLESLYNQLKDPGWHRLLPSRENGPLAPPPVNG